MAEDVPPIPYNAPIVNQGGFISDPWGKWFRQVFTRIGGNFAPSNTDLAASLSGQVSEIDDDVESLSERVSSLENQAAGLGQGPEV